MVRRVLAAGGLLAAIVLSTVVFALPAGASLVGPCTASGEFLPHPDAPDEMEGYEGLNINPKATSGPVTVPRAAAVRWMGAIPGDPGEGRSYRGQLVAQVPPVYDPILDALGSWTELWVWKSDDSTSTSDSDIENYEVPSWVPGGAKIVVAGGHSDDLGQCAGTMVLRLAGSPLSSPITIAVVVVTAAGVIVMISSSIQV